jgi:hypothetical protein
MKLIEEARQAIGEAPDTSVEHLSQQLGVSVGTCHTIVRKDLHLFPIFSLKHPITPRK